MRYKYIGSKKHVPLLLQLLEHKLRTNWLTSWLMVVLLHSATQWIENDEGQ